MAGRRGPGRRPPIRRPRRAVVDRGGEPERARDRRRHAVPGRPPRRAAVVDRSGHHGRAAHGDAVVRRRARAAPRRHGRPRRRAVVHHQQHRRPWLAVGRRRPAVPGAARSGVTRRARSAESRATTLPSSGVIASSRTGVAGSILIPWRISNGCDGGPRRSSSCTSIPACGASASTTRRSARACATTRRSTSRCRDTSPRGTTTTRSTRSCCTRWPTPWRVLAPGTARSGRSIAADLGYVGRRTHDGEVAHELAPWVGRCPAGHEHFRYREPHRPLSCGLCRRGFDRANLIVWRHREITPAVRQRAASAAGG